MMHALEATGHQKMQHLGQLSNYLSTSSGLALPDKTTCWRDSGSDKGNSATHQEPPAYLTPRPGWSRNLQIILHTQFVNIVQWCVPAMVKELSSLQLQLKTDMKG